MFADYHVHTGFSDDSVYPMEDVIKDAIRMGMDEICFTDHVDYGVKEDWDSEAEIVYRDGEPVANVDYPRYAEQIRQMQCLYGDRIAIRMGMEFGMQMHTIPQFQALYDRYPFDFIILSVHQVEDKEFWTQDFQKGRSQKEYHERYYEEMLQVVKALPDTTPSKDILKLYRKLGGEIITIGSDSHKHVHLGMYINEGKELLKSLGFRYFCTYDSMKPVFHKL